MACVRSVMTLTLSQVCESTAGEKDRWVSHQMTFGLASVQLKEDSSGPHAAHWSIISCLCWACKIVCTDDSRHSCFSMTHTRAISLRYLGYLCLCKHFTTPRLFVQSTTLANSIISRRKNDFSFPVTLTFVLVASNLLLQLLVSLQVRVFTKFEISTAFRFRANRRHRTNGQTDTDAAF